ncbi:acyl-CoA dehydrogenase [Microcella flavibacter]|uniref:acyl-CoA dehydrogenase n=1 Tax=Microcella flavibacter TaxID=1804990 RepID=UPI001E301313|nr:acyl-CoA dehydrogenase [Microcella flavibacter]
MHPSRLAAAPAPPGPLLSLLLADPPSAATTGGDPTSGVDAALALAQRLGAARPAPGRPGTRDLWEALATLAADDLALARAVEPHLDAVAILDDADPAAVIVGAWGVFAAEGGDDPLTAEHVDGGWVLTGTKPWCSLADRLDGALVTARVAPATASGTAPAADAPAAAGDRRLFAVALGAARAAGTAHAAPGGWVARGLVEIPSGPVRFAGTPATAVGDPDWYTARPGFAWGGIGVAACWYGGALGVARTLRAAVRERHEPHAEAHLGAVDEALQSARRALDEAAALAEPPRDGEAARPLDRDQVRLLAKRVRATVARAVDEVLHRAGRALGPAPLALDAAHAKRVADLQIYVRQHHAERDLASLGRSIADGGGSW